MIIKLIIVMVLKSIMTQIMIIFMMKLEKDGIILLSLGPESLHLATCRTMKANSL